MPSPALPIARRRRTQLLVLTLGHLLVDTYAGFAQPLIPAFRDRLGVTVASITFVIGVSQILVNAIQPIAGLVAARFSRPVLLIIGLALSACMALIGEADSLWSLAAFILIAHVGIGIFHPDGLTAAMGISGAKAHLGVPMFLSGGYFGYSLAALISTQWVKYFEFTGLWLLAVPAVLVVGMVFATGLMSVDTRGESHHLMDYRGRGPNFWALLVLSVLTVMMTAVVYMFLTTAFDQRWGGKGREWGGLALSVFGFGGTGASFAWGWLSARVSRFALVAVGHVVAVPLFLVFIWSPDPVVMLCFAVPLGMCMGSALFPVLATAAREARGLNANLRAGLIMGGTWGVGSAFAMMMGQLTNHGIQPARFFPYMVIPTVAAAIVSLWMYAVERRQLRQLAQSPADEPVDS